MYCHAFCSSNAVCYWSLKVIQCFLAAFLAPWLAATVPVLCFFRRVEFQLRPRSRWDRVLMCVERWECKQTALGRVWALPAGLPAGMHALQLFLRFRRWFEHRHGFDAWSDCPVVMPDWCKPCYHSYFHILLKRTEMKSCSGHFQCPLSRLYSNSHGFVNLCWLFKWEANTEYSWGRLTICW